MANAAAADLDQQRRQIHVFIAVNLIAILGFALTVVLLLRPGSNDAAAASVAGVAAHKETRMVSVLLPIRDISPGEALDRTMFTVTKMPALNAAPRSLKTFEAIQSQYARSPIPGGVPFSQDSITQIRPTSALTAQIPHGYRAVSITVDVKSAVEGYVRPGAKVDVALSLRINEESGMIVVARNVKVLSAQRHTESSEGDLAGQVPSTVTLLVTEEDSKRVYLASTVGSLTLALRGDSDVGAGVSSSSITVKDLLRGADGAGRANRPGGTVKLRGPKGTVEHWELRDNELTKGEAAAK